MAGGKALLADPRNWRYFGNPLRPSWGEPYIEIAARMLAAARAARDQAGDTAEAVCVSHQLPIVAAAPLRRGTASVARSPTPGMRARLGHLADVLGRRRRRVDYAEPAGATPAGSVAGA